MPGDDSTWDWGRELTGLGGAGRELWSDEFERGFGTAAPATRPETSALVGRARLDGRGDAHGDRRPGLSGWPLALARREADADAEALPLPLPLGSA